MTTPWIKTIWGAALLAAWLPQAQAQQAGDWVFKAGVNTITPQVKSGNLSAASLPNTQVDVKGASSILLTGTRMVTDQCSVEFLAGLPYQHDIQGAGAIDGVGTFATTWQVSPTVMGQYRFGDASSPLRPYAGVGLTYAYFYGEKGSNALTALTAPGSGKATHLSIDAAWGGSAQLGATWRLDERWNLDFSVIKTWLKTSTHLSTGQSIDTRLDPLSVNLSVGWRY
jgi:outer membrane protein